MNITRKTELANITVELTQIIEKLLAIKEAEQKDFFVMDDAFKKSEAGKAIENGIHKLDDAEGFIQYAIDSIDQVGE